MADPSADTCDEHTPETELNGVSNSDDSQHEPDETELLNLTQRFFGDAPVRIRYCSTKVRFIWHSDVQIAYKEKRKFRWCVMCSRTLRTLQKRLKGAQYVCYTLA